MLDGLTIGLPGFFLALQPGARRYAPGFLARSLAFAVPAGAATALCVLAVGTYARIAGHSTEETQSATALALALVAAWILVVASRRLTAPKALILAGMYGGLAILFTLPPVKDFFRVDWPPPDLLAAVLAAAVAGCLTVEAAAWFQRHTADRRSSRPRT